VARSCLRELSAGITNTFSIRPRRHQFRSRWGLHLSRGVEDMSRTSPGRSLLRRLREPHGYSTGISAFLSWSLRAPGFQRPLPWWTHPPSFAAIASRLLTRSPPARRGVSVTFSRHLANGGRLQNLNHRRFCIFRLFGGSSPFGILTQQFSEFGRS
jgi:hypothetical protein